MKNFLLSIFLIVMVTNSSSAETRFAGKNIADWNVYTEAKGEITKGTFNTIVFSGDGMKTGYRLNFSHKDATKISWEMEFTEFYAIYLKVSTTNGERTLRYTSLDKDIGKKNGYINFGLGHYSRMMYGGAVRDVQKDVEKFEAGNKLISIDTMMVRGSGAIGNIKTTSAQKEVIVEDAFNSKIKNWSIFTDTKGTATGYRNEVKLEGEGMKTGYSLSFPKLDESFKIVSWAMTYSENYAVYILVNTTDGVKYLRYTSLSYDKGVDGRYISFGLGANSKNGKWHSFRRNLEHDLKKFQPNNKILSIKAFMIRGSGLVDNIKAIQVK